MLVHSDPPCHSPPVGTGQEECRGGAASPGRPGQRPPAHSLPANILTSPRRTSSPAPSLTPLCLAAGRQWLLQQGGGGGGEGKHLSQDNFFMSCGPKAGRWVDFLCGLRCHSSGQKNPQQTKVKCISDAGRFLWSFKPEFLEQNHPYHKRSLFIGYILPWETRQNCLLEPLQKYDAFPVSSMKKYGRTILLLQASS